MKQLKANPDQLGFTVELPEGDSNLKLWNIKIFKVDNPKLQDQLKKLNIPFITLEIKFPDLYPIEPPFIRIISPRFKLLTGHITSGGSICLQALSKQGWIPTTNIESLIIQIKMALSDGGAIIDEINLGNTYTFEEAKIAFQRAEETHKHEWTV
jgi:ubiquitin-conjugating enzyme E2 Q